MTWLRYRRTARRRAVPHTHPRIDGRRSDEVRAAAIDALRMPPETSGRYVATTGELLAYPGTADLSSLT